ncbi:MAG: hypothetical protein O2919_07470 [Chloroflexi bacterium]|nr:hypothetical protein [Chloroflexota bacterium]
MAGNRQSGAFHRREQEEREARTRRLMTFGIGGVLALVAVIVAVGVVWSVILPPRAEVGVVGTRTLTAGDLADHAIFMYRTGDTRPLGDPTTAMDDLILKEALLQSIAPELEPITDADVRALLAVRLGIEGEVEDELYASSLAAYLRQTEITRAEVEYAGRALVVEERLREQLEEAVPETGEMIFVLRVATADRTRAEALIERVAAGESLGEAAVAIGIYTEAPQADFGRWAPEVFPERVRAELIDLEAGEVTGVLDDEARVGFEVYQVSIRTTEEPYDEANRERLAAERFVEIMAERREQLGATVTLSESERTWVLNRLSRAVRR